MDLSGHFSRLATALIGAFNSKELQSTHRKIAVNPLVSTVASWYEKLRNAMDYRDEEVILRAAIERILKRRLMLGGDGKKVAESLIRELVWARYFPDESLSEGMIAKVEKKIDLFLSLRDGLIAKKTLSESVASEWLYHLLSSDIEFLLNPTKEKEVMANFMYQIMRNNVVISDDTEQNKDVQVLIAVRRAYAKDDLAFLRYHLFVQIFGEISDHSLEKITQNFSGGYKEIQQQLNYPRKDRIYSYVKSKTGVFFILEDLLNIHKDGIKVLFTNKEELAKQVFAICEARYSKISARVRRAIVRSVIFILLTKAFFAFAVEGTLETLLYGRVMWQSLMLNTGIPPILMIIVSIFLHTPGHENSKRILIYIESILSEESPSIGNPLVIKKTPDKRPVLDFIFNILWFLTFLLVFGGVIFVLSKLQVLFISQAIFLFFLAIVSFLSYRISLMTREYTVGDKLGWGTPIFDFFFMPVIRVGRHLTEGISQVNIFMFILDFMIETPFKSIFGFFEQWFFFLHAKREEL